MPPQSSQHTPPSLAQVPAAHAWVMRQWLLAQGISPVQWLAEAGLPTDALPDAKGQLSVQQCEALMLAAHRLTHDDGLGYQLGLCTPITAHGPLGLAVLSAQNVQQALGLVLRFAQAQNPTVGWQVEPTDTRVTLRLVDHLPGGPARRWQMQWVLIAVCMAGLQACGRTRPGQWAGCQLHWPWPEPESHAGWADALPHCAFNSDWLGISVPSHWLFEALPGAAPATWAWAQEALQSSPHGDTPPAKTARLPASSGTPSVTDAVRQRLRRQALQGTQLDLAGMASALHRSASTLKRQLLAEGSRFSQLQAQVHCEVACQWLASPSIQVAEVAQRLGYDNTANFTRAFRRWTGMPPAQWRVTAAGAGLSGSTPHPRPAPAARSEGAAPSGSTRR